MPVTKVKEYLDAEGVKYLTINHSRAYTALEVAASAHLKGKAIAKTVVVKLDSKPAMAVLPANKKVDLERLRQGSGAISVDLVEKLVKPKVLPM